MPSTCEPIHFQPTDPLHQPLVDGTNRLLKSAREFRQESPGIRPRGRKPFAQAVDQFRQDCDETICGVLNNADIIVVRNEPKTAPVPWKDLAADIDPLLLGNFLFKPESSQHLQFNRLVVAANGLNDVLREIQETTQSNEQILRHTLRHVRQAMTVLDPDTAMVIQFQNWTMPWPRSFEVNPERSEITRERAWARQEQRRIEALHHD